MEVIKKKYEAEATLSFHCNTTHKGYGYELEQLTHTVCLWTKYIGLAFNKRFNNSSF